MKIPHRRQLQSVYTNCSCQKQKKKIGEMGSDGQNVQEGRQWGIGKYGEVSESVMANEWP
jgi:hypothetical protein